MVTRLVCALLVSVAAIAPAVAQANDPVSASIDTRDLDLSTSKDRARLDTRVKSTAHAMCRSGMRGTVAQALEVECVKLAMASARPQVDLAVANASGAIRIAAVAAKRGG